MFVVKYLLNHLSFPLFPFFTSLSLSLFLYPLLPPYSVSLIPFPSSSPPPLPTHTSHSQTVDKVFSLYSKAFQASKKYKGDIIKIHYLEESRNSKVPTKKTRHPEVVGYRYLLELDIQLHEPEEKLIHTSEYVYLPKDSTELCHTSNFQWRKSPTVDVYFVVSCEYTLYSQHNIQLFVHTYMYMFMYNNKYVCLSLHAIA